MPFLSPKTRCALTAPFHPCRFPGGLFSAALSIASRRPGITRRFALRSPDFPPAIRLQAAVCPARRKDYTTFAPEMQNRSPHRNINPAPAPPWSFRRKPESSVLLFAECRRQKRRWIPAFAGMTSMGMRRAAGNAAGGVAEFVAGGISAARCGKNAYFCSPLIKRRHHGIMGAALQFIDSRRPI